MKQMRVLASTLLLILTVGPVSAKAQTTKGTGTTGTSTTTGTTPPTGKPKGPPPMGGPGGMPPRPPKK